MKNIKFYFLFGVAALFAACSNDADSVIEPASPSVANTSFLNLQSLDYNDLAEVLSNVTSSGKEVTLIDGSKSRVIILQRNQAVKVKENGREVDLYKGSANDSINAILSSNYATLRLFDNGELISYVAYKNDEDMRRVSNYYQTQFLPSQSRSLSEIVTLLRPADTRSIKSEVGCVRINSTRAIEANPNKAVCEDDYSISKQLVSSNYTSTVSNRADTPTLDFILVKEKSSNNLDHEITWQIESTTTSLHFPIGAGFFTVAYDVIDSDYEEGNDFPEAAIDNFQKYLKGWDAVSGRDDKIFILMKNGTWNGTKVLGYAADLGMIHLYIPDSDFNIRALSTSSSLYPHTLAHEVGHLFGATHTEFEEDVMYKTFSPNSTAYHKSADNWDRMVNCIIQKP